MFEIHASALLPDNIFPAVLLQRAELHYMAPHNYVEDCNVHMPTVFPSRGGEQIAS